MIRLLFRLVMLVVLLVGVAVLAFGYRWGNVRGDAPSPVGTSGDPIDTDRASRAGAEIAERVAEGASRAGQALEQGKLTAKIRSKMTLDDTIDASGIDVDTAGTVVTLKGSVATRKEHQRVLQLARETAGVTNVVDQLSVREGR
jgi:hyperosmotically inducible protein